MGQKSLNEIMNPEKEQKAVVALPIDISPASMFLDVVKFEHMWRVGELFSKSDLVPEVFRKRTANCVIAFNYAVRVNMDPFMVMQNMYIIHGKPAIEAKLQIALFNANPGFTKMRYHLDGKGDSLSCFAFATDKETGEKIDGPLVTIQMAKDEGWYHKNGSKWKTLPDLMIRYRAAAFFIRTYAPETTLGVHTTDELNDQTVIDITDKSDLAATLKEAVSETVAAKKETKPVEETKDKEDPREDIINSQLKAQEEARGSNQEEPKEEPKAHPWDRKNWINMKDAGLSTFVMKNKDTFHEISEYDQKSVRSKWARIYPDSPFVLDREENQDLSQQNQTQSENKEPVAKKCMIYGVDICKNFFMKGKDTAEILGLAQEIWDHPSDYRDDIGDDGSESAWNDFLKHLFISYEDQTKPLYDCIKKEKSKTGTVNEQTVECPNGDGIKSVVHCNGTCRSRVGCPAFA